MARGQYRGGKAMTVESSPNSSTWRAKAEELEAQLDEAASEQEELQSRLDAIADIAAPDLNERAERIDETLVALASGMNQLHTVLDLLLERMPLPPPPNPPQD